MHHFHCIICLLTCMTIRFLMYVSRSGRKQHQQQQSKASRHKPPWSLFATWQRFWMIDLCLNDMWCVLCLVQWDTVWVTDSKRSRGFLRGGCVYMLVVHLLNCKLSFTLHYHQLLSMSLSFPYPLYPPYFYFFPLSSDMCLIIRFFSSPFLYSFSLDDI